MEDADDRRKRLKAMRAEASAGGVAVEAAPGAGKPFHIHTERLARWLASAMHRAPGVLAALQEQARRGC